MIDGGDKTVVKIGAKPFLPNETFFNFASGQGNQNVFLTKREKYSKLFLVKEFGLYSMTLCMIIIKLEVGNEESFVFSISSWWST